MLCKICGSENVESFQTSDKKTYWNCLYCNGKFLDEDGKKMVGVYIVLDKQEQLNQPFFFKTLQDITEMSEKTNRFLIKAL